MSMSLAGYIEYDTSKELNLQLSTEKTDKEKLMMNTSSKQRLTPATDKPEEEKESENRSVHVKKKKII